MIRFFVSTLGLGIALFAISLPLHAPDAAMADTEQTQLDKKADWQDRYRTLLRNVGRLEYNARISRESYARAQRRNYPRGGARQNFILEAESAEKELVTVKAKIDEFFVDARHAAIPRGWFYEVDDETIVTGPPASASEQDDDDRAGRNPLYLPERDDP